LKFSFISKTGHWELSFTLSVEQQQLQIGVPMGLNQRVGPSTRLSLHSQCIAYKAVAVRTTVSGLLLRDEEPNRCVTFRFEDAIVQGRITYMESIAEFVPCVHFSNLKKLRSLHRSRHEYMPQATIDRLCLVVFSEVAIAVIMISPS